MAVGVAIELPVTKEQYDTVNERLFGSSNPDPSLAPPGLIVHTAGASGGSWRIFDVWESADAFESFMQRVGPIVQELGMNEPMEPQIYELANVWPR